MKKVTKITLATLLFVACNFSKGIKKDLTTGLTTTNNGLSVEEVHLIDDKNNALNSNKVTLGSEFQIVATGVENFTEQNGKAYPGCTIILTDKNGAAIVDVQDAYANLVNGASIEDAKTLTATVNTGKPMVVGETYDVKVRFFDKKNKENEIISTISIVAK